MIQLHPAIDPVLLPNNQLGNQRISHPSALNLQVGQDLQVKYYGRDPASGKMRLSRKVITVAKETAVRDLHRATQRSKTSPSSSPSPSPESPPTTPTPPTEPTIQERIAALRAKRMAKEQETSAKTEEETKQNILVDHLPEAALGSFPAEVINDEEAIV